MKDNVCKEQDILVVNAEIFGDNEEHEFDFECYNGYAVGTPVSDNEPVKEITMVYPKLEDVLEDDDMCDEILRYRGLYDLTKEDITYGDIMMKYGEIKPYFEVGDLVRWNDPAIGEFAPAEQDWQSKREYKIFDIKGDIICICDEYGEGEVLAHELVLVKKSEKTL